jgi:hypothetical protein
MLNDLFLPDLEFCISSIFGHIPYLRMRTDVRVLDVMIVSSVCAIHPPLKQIILSNGFSLASNNDHPIFILRNSEGDEVILVLKLDMRHIVNGLNGQGLIVIECIVDGICMGLCFCFCFMNDPHISSRESSVGRLTVSDRQMIEGSRDLASEPDDVLVRNTHIPDVIKELVEGVVRVANDQDTLCRVLEDALGEESPDEGFTGT